jgi:thiol-disulfide isomerase/thioredoxin
MKVMNDFLKLFKGKDAPMNVLILVAAAVVGIFLCKLLSNVMKEGFGEKILKYFHMDGCGHCKKFDPTWDEFVKQHDEAGTGIKLEKIEAANAPDNINGYPSIHLMDGNNKVDELKGERSVASLNALCQNNA